MPKVIDWEPIKRAYLVSGKSLESIAAEFGVSVRSIQGKSAAEGWADSREQAPKLVNKPRPTVKGTGAIDELEVIEQAIADLQADIVDAPIKSKESAITALVRLLEYREKLMPSTASDLAERAIALGISPEQFLEELRQAWAAQS